MPSPNAASLGLYGEVPVSLYTGTPNIEIPIYTIQEGKINVPVSLSYHASGVRVNQHPGSVGLNWNLNAGGAITRMVKGGADESSLPGAGGTKSGYYYRGGSLSAENWNTLPGVVNILSQKLSPGGRVLFDTEPDEFMFNFLGYSGKFYRNHTGGWQVISDSDIRIQNTDMLDVPSNMNRGALNEQTFGGFILTTVDGMKYHFGGKTSAIEYSTLFFEQKIDIWTANTWQLTKIESPEGYSVNFTYATQSEGKYIASFFNSFQSGDTKITLSWNQSSYNFRSLNQFSGTLNRPVYLSKIAFSKGYIDFTHSPTTELKYPNRVLGGFEKFLGSDDNVDFPDVKYLDDAFTYLEGGGHFLWPSRLSEQIPIMIDRLVWQKLDNISIKQSNGTTIQSIDLGYNNISTQRLMLKKVSFKNGECKNNYDFSYYNENSLPEYFDEYDQTDHWGFYNNNTSFKYEDIAHNTGNYFSHKQPSVDINVLNAGTLEQITYPTGGTTRFLFEPHSMYKYKVANVDGSLSLENAMSQKVGGIRIKEIASNDGIITKKKRYSYEWNSGSSGIGSGIHQYNANSLQNYYSFKGEKLGSHQRNTFSVNNTLPMSVNSFGSHIGYRQVKEINDDDSYTVYNYTNYESNDGSHMDDFVLATDKLGSQGNMYDPQIDKSIERGKLLSEENYGKNGLVSKKVISYKKLSSDFVRGVIASDYRFQIGPNSFVTYLGMPYGYHAYKYQPDREVVYSFDEMDQSKFTLDSIFYTYNDIGLPIEAKTKRNDKVKKTLNKYVSDYAMPVTPTQESSISINSMKTLGMNGVLVEQQIWNNENGTDGMVDGNINLFRRYNANSGFSNIQIEKTYRFSSTSPEAAVALSNTDAGLFTYNDKYSNLILDFGSDNAAGYTLNGEPKQFKGADGIWNYFTWYDGTKTGLVRSKNIGNQETMFDYDNPLVGVSKITDPKGIYTTYTYDGFNRLETVRDYKGNLLNSYAYNLKNSLGCEKKSIVPSSGGDPVADDIDESCAAPVPAISKTSGTTVCTSANQRVTLTASGCTGTITWFKDGTQLGEGVTFETNISGSYTAKCKVGDCLSTASGSIILNQTEGCATGSVDGCYTMTNADNGKLITNVNGIVKIKPASGAGSQIWKVSSSGAYVKIAGEDGKVFGVENSGNASGSRIILQTDGGQDHQLWSKVSTGSSYVFVGKGSDLRFGSTLNWGGGDASDAVADLYLTSDPNNSYGSNKWQLTSASCPNPGCPAPTVSKGSGTVCSASGQIVTLTASGSGTIQWYKDGVAFKTGSSVTTDLPGSYAATSTVGGCVSPASSGLVVSQTSGCGTTGSVSCSGYTFTDGQVIGNGYGAGNAVIHIVSGCAVVYWEGGAVTGRVNRDWLAGLAGKTIPDNVLSSCVKWDGEALNSGGCTTLPSAPTIIKTSGTTVCTSPSQSVTLTATNCSGSITWFRDGRQVGTGATYTTSVAGNYTATCTVSGCTSTASSSLTVSSGCVTSIVPVLSIWKAGAAGVRTKVKDLAEGDQIQKSVFAGGQANWFIASSGQVSNSGAANYYDKVQVQLNGPNGISTGWGPDLVAGSDGGPFGVYNRDNGITPQAGAYTMSGKLWNGATELGSQTVNFTIVENAICTAPTISMTSGTTVCSSTNQQVTLTASGCTGTVTWFKDGSQTGTGATYTTSVTGTYTATCTASGCVSPASSGLVVSQTSGCGTSGSVSCSGYTFTDGQVIGNGYGAGNAVIHIVSGCAVAYWEGGAGTGRINRDWLAGLAGKTIPDNVLSSCVKWDGEALNSGGTPTCASPRNPENPTGLSAGLNFNYYESAAGGNWCATSALAGQSIVKSGTTSNLLLSQSNRADSYGFEFIGYLDVPADGEYTFYLLSDDASAFYVGTQLVTGYEGCHGMDIEQSGRICLKAGKHAIKAVLMQGGGGAGINLQWSGPGLGKQAIPDNRLFRGDGTVTPYCSFTPTASASNTNPGPGTGIQLSAGCSGSGCGGVSYEWNGTGISNVRGQNPSITVPSTAGSYSYTVTASKSGCSNRTAAVTITVVVQPSTSACYELSLAGNNMRLSNHAGLVKVKVADNSNSQIWKIEDAGASYVKLIAQGGTDNASIGFALGIRNQGSAQTNPVDLQNSTTGDHQLWKQIALTGSDAGRYVFERKNTSFIVGSARNWGNGILSDGESDLSLGSDPNRTYGSNKWVLTSKTCPEISALDCNFTPTASASNTNPAPGASIQLSAGCSGCNGVSYVWNGPGVSNVSGQNPSITVPSAAGSYSYTVTAGKRGCSNKTASVTITVAAQPGTSTCYELSLAGNNMRLSNHAGLVKVKAMDNSNSQIWKIEDAGSGYVRLIAQGGTTRANSGYTLGVRNQGSAQTNPVDLQNSTTGDHQLWKQIALTGSDAGRYVFERKNTSFIMGSARNWGNGILSDGESDLSLGSDPNRTYGANKWVLTSKTCPYQR